MRLTLPLNLPVRERPQLRLLRRAPVVQIPEDPQDPEVGALLRLSDGSIFALSSVPPGQDFGIRYPSDRVFGDLPIRTEATADDLLLVITIAGPAKVTLGDLINTLET